MSRRGPNISLLIAPNIKLYPDLQPIHENYTLCAEKVHAIGLTLKVLSIEKKEKKIIKFIFKNYSLSNSSRCDN